MSINRMDKKYSCDTVTMECSNESEKITTTCNNVDESQTQSLAKETKHKKSYCAILYIKYKDKTVTIYDVKSQGSGYPCAVRETEDRREHEGVF